MKAIVYTEYGSVDVLQEQEIDKPVPSDDEVLIRLHAVSLNRSDWESLIGKPLYSRIGGLTKPRRQVLGSDIAGTVEAVGKACNRLKPGDEVFGDILGRMGGFAEYVCANESDLAIKPHGITFEQASAIPQAAVIALQGIRDKGQVKPGQKVLINGAGGGAGTFALQLAKLYGAEVTGVDTAEKAAFMRSLGADHVVDYTHQDFTKTGEKYDLILDLVAHRSAFAYRRALRKGGSYYYVGGSVSTLLQLLILGGLIGRLSGRRVGVLAVKANTKDLLHITDLCEAGKLIPAIDRTFPLSEVPEALNYLGEGRSLGKVVIQIRESEN